VRRYTKSREEVDTHTRGEEIMVEAFFFIGGISWWKGNGEDDGLILCFQLFCIEITSTFTFPYINVHIILDSNCTV